MLNLFLCKLVLVSYFQWSFAEQTWYKVVQENFTLEYSDPKLLDLQVGVYRLNRTANALNCTTKFNFTPQENIKYLLKAFKWHDGVYDLNIIQIETTLKKFTEMENFDLQAFFLDYTRPQFVWPLEKGVVYRSLGWVPDSSKFPPNVPAGRWKVQSTVTFANKTKIFVANWFINVIYK